MAASILSPSQIRLADSDLLRRLNLVVYKAVRAPSVHNTQPWSFVATSGGGLTIRADRSRQLAVLDPSGRQLMISCGCALFNARLPDPNDPGLLARLDLSAADTSAASTEDAEVAALEPVIQVRHSNRRRFSKEPLPPELLDTLRRWLPTATRSSRRQCLLILGTEADNPSGWLRAGEALERVLLEIARHGYTASLFSQIIEVPEARAALRAELRLSTHPVMVLRVGRAHPTAGTPRRPVGDVLTELR